MWKWWLIGIAIVLVIGVGYVVYTQTANRANETVDETSIDQESQISDEVTGGEELSSVSWQFTGSEWRASGTPPACANPVLFESPVDVSQATSILYPGQERGGNYKPHGGFRFDNSTDNLVSVTAPMSGVVVNGARYLVGGETQYTFDVIAPCGIMYRLGHLLELTSKYQTLAESFPAAVEGDSRTTNIDPPVAVVAGEEIATAVGVRADTNTFVDWGVYDLRQKNSSASDTAWLKLHSDDTMLAPYAVCWFDMLSAADAATVKSLPAADPASGTKSDYCR